MSGSAGIRGYFYQVLAGLLESVENDTWESIRIEPSTEGDKVDIEWIFNDSIRAVQVKSSINNFERGSVVNWVYSLVKDAKAAYEIFDVPISYSLYLIGTTDRIADKWISDLHGGRLEISENDKLKEIESELSNIEVKKQSFEFEPLQALSYLRMQEYLLHIGREANLENTKTLCSVLVSELLTFTIQGRQMPKSFFLKLINKHLNSGVYGISSITRTKAELSLIFYENGKVSESNEMGGIRLENTPILEKFRREAINYLHQAKNIKLPMQVPVETDIEEQDKPTTLIEPDTIKVVKGLSKTIKDIVDSTEIKNFENYGKSYFNHISKDGYIKVQFSADEIKEIIELSKSILGIDLTDEDFYFGELEKRIVNTHLMFGGPRNIPRGTDDERTKYFSIDNAYSNLLGYKYILKYTEYLNKCYPLPIVLKNSGGLADEEIQVTIKLPPTALVVTPERMEVPFEPFIEDFITEDNVYNNLVIPARDHGVMEYVGLWNRMPVLPKRPLPFETISYTPEDFADHLDFLFNYEYFRKGDQDIVQYEFKSLNPSCKMAFPTFLLVQTDCDMNIEYTITSKYLSEPIKGSLQWFHPNNKEAEEFEQK